MSEFWNSFWKTKLFQICFFKLETIWFLQKMFSHLQKFETNLVISFQFSEIWNCFKKKTEKQFQTFKNWNEFSKIIATCSKIGIKNINDYVELLIVVKSSQIQNIAFQISRHLIIHLVSNFWIFETNPFKFLEIRNDSLIFLKILEIRNIYIFTRHAVPLHRKTRETR